MSRSSRSDSLPSSLGGEEEESTTSTDEFGMGDRLRSLWNQLRFGWTIVNTPKFSPGVPIYFLGRRYVDLQSGNRNDISCGALDGDIDGFLTDFRSRLWFTYRDAFPPLLVTPCSPIPAAGHLAAAPPKTTAALRHQHLLPSPNGVSSAPSDHQIHLSVRTSDCGWGCMLRSAQMLLAQALLVHFMGRGWTSATTTTKELAAARLHCQVIRWFADTPASPLSIHRLVEASGSPPGTLYGPATICQALLVAMANASTPTSAADRDADIFAQVEVYLARDRVICKEEVMDLFEEVPSYRDLTPPPDPIGHHRLQPESSTQRGLLEFDAKVSYQPPPVDLSDPFVSLHELLRGVAAKPQRPRGDRRGLLLLVPMRLGAGRRIEAAYVPTVLRLLKDASSVGLIGGRPRHSVFIAGAQADQLIYMDPHFCQDAVDVGPADGVFDVSSWHCPTPRLMPARKLDPCCAFGFYCGSRAELTNLLTRLPVISELRSPRCRRSNGGGHHSNHHHLIEVVLASKAEQLYFGDLPPPCRPSFSASSPSIDEHSYDDGGFTS